MHVEDYVQGTYKGVQLELCEARMTRTEGSGKNRRNVTIFAGLMIRLSMHKNFKGHTVVKQDNLILKQVYAGKIWGRDVPDGLEKVTLEDPEFERQFRVYSTDQIESRYLLTTSFMERLKHLQAAVGGSSVEASFLHNQLLLLIASNENRFEPDSVFKPVGFEEASARIVHEMRDIFALIDLLQLDRKTGL
jgi:hypothetical protein